MRCRAEQTSQQVVYAIASIIAVTQPAYSMRSDELPARFECVKSQPMAEFTSNIHMSISSPVSHTSFNVIPDEMRFDYLAARWRDESAVMSSTTEMVLCPSYQSIMAMGEI